MSPFLRRLCYWYVYFGEKIGIVDRGVMQAMRDDGGLLSIVLLRVGDEGVFSPFWWFIGRKVEGRPRGGVCKKEGIYY